MITNLPSRMGTLDFSNWGYGLLSAFIGGGSGAFSAGLSVIMVDPNDFNLWAPKFWKVIVSTFFIGGIVPFFAYLHNKPLPDIKVVETTTKRVEGFLPDQTTTTVKETRTEVVDPKLETKP